MIEKGYTKKQIKQFYVKKERDKKILKIFKKRQSSLSDYAFWNDVQLTIDKQIRERKIKCKYT